MTFLGFILDSDFPTCYTKMMHLSGIGPCDGKLQELAERINTAFAAVSDHMVPLTPSDSFPLRHNPGLDKEEQHASVHLFTCLTIETLI